MATLDNLHYGLLVKSEQISVTRRWWNENHTEWGNVDSFDSMFLALLWVVEGEILKFEFEDD